VNSEDLINFAEKAGFVVDEKARQHQPNCIFHTHHMVDELLAVFADLIAAHEREQCAQLMDDMAARDKLTNYYKVAALAIRERKS